MHKPLLSQLAVVIKELSGAFARDAEMKDYRGGKDGDQLGVFGNGCFGGRCVCLPLNMKGGNEISKALASDLLRGDIKT